MTRGRVASRIAGLLLVCAAASCAGPAKPSDPSDRPSTRPAPAARLRHQFVIPESGGGGGLRVVVYCADAAGAARAEQAAADRFARFQKVFDEGRPDSEVSQIHANAGLGAVRVSDELYYLLRQAERLSVRADGAVEPTAGAYDALWRAAAAGGRLPTDEELARADALVGPTKLRLDAIDRTAHLTEPGARLDLSPFVRGYACDVVLDALGRAGFPVALVDAGRRIAVGDAPPGTKGWPVRVNNAGRKAPERTLTLVRQGVASSGTLADSVAIDGQSYALVMDPRTAIGTRNLAPATAVARRAWQADGLARAAAVLGERRGRKLARSLRNAKVWFHYPPGTSREQFEPAAGEPAADEEDEDGNAATTQPSD
jgi:thiamine biosynthesis lipoprotein